MQFTFQITNKQQQQQKINPDHNPKGKTCGDQWDDRMTYLFTLCFTRADLVLHKPADTASLWRTGKHARKEMQHKSAKTGTGTKAASGEGH